MKVLAIWYDSDILNGEWKHANLTSFWVEVAPDELPQVLSHASDPKALAGLAEDNRDQGKNKYYFLISRELESISTFPSYFPFSGQWNGQSPFIQLEPPVEISSLDELKGIK